MAPKVNKVPPHHAGFGVYLESVVEDYENRIAKLENKITEMTNKKGGKNE